MPIIRIGTGLVYFAHVPKCAGSSVENYLRERFGPLGFLDRQYLSLPENERWSKSSPQHIDWAGAERLFPEGFFSESFAVVRHPVARVISAYHFQVEVEKTSQSPTGFGDWLQQNLALQKKQPYLMDGHLRPQSDFIPPDCNIFHLEHGLDALIPYFDALAGDQAEPRAMDFYNARKKAGSKKSPETALSTEDLALIAEIYAEDFASFGYRLNEQDPVHSKPVLDPAFVAENAAARKRASQPLNRVVAKVRRRLRRL